MTQKQINLEKIAKGFGLCNCDEAYKSRDLNDPNCPLHSFAVEEAMREAIRQALELAADEADIGSIGKDRSHEYIVDKQSIMNVLNKVV